MDDSVSLPTPGALLDRIVEGSIDPDSAFLDYQFFQVLRFFARTRDWDGLDEYVGEFKHVAALPSDVENASASATVHLGAAIVAWIDEVGAKVQSTDDVKAIALSLDSSEQTVLGAFLCDRDEDDSQDWPAYFNVDVRGPHLYPVLGPWLRAFSDDPRSANIGFRSWRTAAISTVGHAVAGWDWGVPLFWVEDDVTLAIS